MLYISGLRRKKPSLDFSLTITSPELTDVSYVAALPGGGAFVKNYISDDNIEQILKINSQGKVTQTIYTCKGCSIQGLLVLGDFLYLTKSNGTVIKTRVSDGRILSSSTIPAVGDVLHKGSLYSKPDRINDKQTLLLCDREKDEVFTFKPSTGQKQVRVSGLRKPQSVSYFFYNHIVYYIVSERLRIIVYNQTWDLVRTIGTRGSEDVGGFGSAIVSDEDTIIISDYFNHRISELSFNGTFLRHLISDGILWPTSMSYYYPHLWLSDGVFGFLYNDLYRYNLYK